MGGGAGIVSLGLRAGKEAVMMKVLLIDDDRLLGRLIVRGAHARGIEVQYCESLCDALHCGYFNGFDLIVLDCAMPTVDGEEILDYMRRFNPQVPVLMISSNPHSLINIMKRTEGLVPTLSKAGGLERILDGICKHGCSLEGGLHAFS